MDELHTKIALICIWVATFFLNLLVIVALGRKFGSLRIQDLVLIAVAVCDFTQGLISYPVEIFFPSGTNLMLCKISGWALESLALTVISLLTSLSIIRMVSISYPLKSYEFLSKQSSSLLFIVPSVLYGFAWGTFPWFGWSNFEPEMGIYPRCSLNLRSRELNPVSYGFSLFAFCYVVPVFFMVYNLLKIRKELFKMIRSSIRVSGSESEATKTSIETEKKLSLVLLVMILAYLFAWTPYAVVMCLVVNGTTISKTIFDIAAMVGKSAACYNPMIYALLYKDFRGAVKELFGIKENEVSPETDATDA